LRPTRDPLGPVDRTADGPQGTRVWASIGGDTPTATATDDGGGGVVVDRRSNRRRDGGLLLLRLQLQPVPPFVLLFAGNSHGK